MCTLRKSHRTVCTQDDGHSMIPKRKKGLTPYFRGGSTTVPSTISATPPSAKRLGDGLGLTTNLLRAGSTPSLRLRSRRNFCLPFVSSAAVKSGEVKARAAAMNFIVVIE